MAIIKYRVEAKCDIASEWQYEEVTDPRKNGRILTKDQAMKIIEERELVLVHQNKHGSIWDAPDEPMKQTYEGIYTSIKF